jgi:hypothetical protein
MQNKFILLLILGVQFFSCDPPITNSCANDFDQLSLLDNVGTNIIAPSYQEFAQKINDLNSKTTSFCNSPSANELYQLRNAMQVAWLQWQETAIFEFGPAETANLRTFMGEFPVFTTRLNEAISTGSYDLSSDTYSFTRGFPALDYLLYGSDTSTTSVLTEYTTNSLASNRKQYLSDVVSLMLAKATTVNDAWKTDGANYLFEFTTTEGIANGKPMSDLVNQLNMGYELIKNDRIGTPISVKTGYLPLLPQNVEAFYSRNSLSLSIAGIEACKRVFMGTNATGNSTGLDDFLIASGAKKGSEDLHTAIINQYDLAINSLKNLEPNSLHDAILNDTENVKVAYAAVQNQMVQTKTDMPAALCISITYIDMVDDGD